MSTDAIGDLTVVMPTRSSTDPTPSHNDLCSNGVPPSRATSSDTGPAVPYKRQSKWSLAKDGFVTQKKDSYLEPRASSVDLGSLAMSMLHKKSSFMLKNVSKTFTLSPTIQQTEGSFDSDPVVNTIRQLRKEDRRDRDMCCGFAPAFRKFMKAMWMLTSVVIVWCGFIGLEQCKGRPLAPAYVAVQGLGLLIYLGLVEVSGAVAIWKGRRWGVLVLLLSQSLVVLTLVFGYTALLGMTSTNQVQLMFRDNTSLHNTSGVAGVNMSFPSNETSPIDCDPNYLNFAKVLFALGHLTVVAVLLYSLVACVCLVHAEGHRRKVEPPIITTESPVHTPEAGGGTLKDGESEKTISDSNVGIGSAD